MGTTRWVPKPIWRGLPCYIIGGGTSLEGFPFEILKGRNVLGCNVAFYMGASLVPYTIFGDSKFLRQNIDGLKKYVEDGGNVVTNSGRMRGANVPDWLKIMRKQLHGLATNGLGWNANTGASAINLALIMGANPVYLLGFDMRLGTQGRANYHNAYSNTPKAKAFTRFLRGMKSVSQELPIVFPSRKIINLEDDTSSLEVFPKESLKTHFAEKEA